MSRTHVSLTHHPMGYDFPDWMALNRRNWALGVGLSALLCVAVLFAGLEASRYLEQRARAHARWVNWVVPLPMLAIPSGAPPAPQHHTAAPPPRAVPRVVQPTVAARVVPVPDRQAPTQPSPAVSSGPSSSSEPGAPTNGDQTAAGTGGPPRPGDYVYHDQEPELVNSVEPQYPEMARSAGLEGRVVLQVYVAPSGHVEDVLVKQGVPMLNDAAVKAVRQYLFKPAMASGKPVGVWVVVPILFRLTGS